MFVTFNNLVMENIESSGTVAVALVERKLSLLRRYIVEILIVVLTASVVYMFQKQDRMNERLIRYYIEDKNRDQQHLINNSSVIETNNVILRDLRQMYRELDYKKSRLDTLAK